eukprot:CAMPEP_0196581102 /NCGR_PEP_ID=MMETSP1081-20130531/32403_1 /TAXON_ID=36882 /ORGANISM="Pyramimonas amylifera, Strain CCMP720" /LENGTH=172 /DNA_ID=CAMNT_0041901203 /DNA_START=36 /DNA_END=553 /DNA_ORIENTATION=+
MSQPLAITPVVLQMAASSHCIRNRTIRPCFASTAKNKHPTFTKHHPNKNQHQRGVQMRSFNEDGGFNDMEKFQEILSSITQEGEEFEKSLEQCLAAFSSKDWERAKTLAMEAEQFVQVYEARASKALESATTFAARASLEVDPKRQVFARRAVAAAHLDAAEQEQYAVPVPA